MDRYYTVRRHPIQDHIEVLKWEKPKDGIVHTKHGSFFFNDFMVTTSYPVIVSHNGSVRCGCPASRFRSGNCKHQYLINDFISSRSQGYKYEVVGHC